MERYRHFKLRRRWEGGYIAADCQTKCQQDTTCHYFSKLSTNRVRYSIAQNQNPDGWDLIFSPQDKCTVNCRLLNEVVLVF